MGRHGRTSKGSATSSSNNNNPDYVNDSEFNDDEPPFIDANESITNEGSGSSNGGEASEVRGIGMADVGNAERVKIRTWQTREMLKTAEITT